MKRKYPFLLAAVLLAAGGFWLTRSSSSRQDFTSQTTTTAVGANTPSGSNDQADVMVNGRMNQGPQDNNGVPSPNNTRNPQDRGEIATSPAQLTPPVPNKRFTDFTPEQRVEFARKGHGPGG